MGADGVPIALAMGWQGQGKKLRAAPLQQRARGAAVRCQPKPLTRPWVSAVLAIGRKDIWQMWMRAFNVGAIDAIRQTASMGLPNLNAQSAGDRTEYAVAAKLVADANRKAGLPPQHRPQTIRPV